MKKLLLILLVSCKSITYYQSAYHAVIDNPGPIIVTHKFDYCRVELTDAKGKVFYADICYAYVGDTVRIETLFEVGEVYKVN